MDTIRIESEWLEEPLFVEKGKPAMISVVAYEHPLGMPARFCIGLVPAAILSKQLSKLGIPTTVRLIDPSSIANYCNGWSQHDSRCLVIVTRFFQTHDVPFLIDSAKSVSEEMLHVLRSIGSDLDTATQADVLEMVDRIRESGRKHGGDAGVDNTLLYMAAHPFSWLDLYHPSVWSMQHSAKSQYINVMSKPEARFTVVRKYLRELKPDLCSGLSITDAYMTVSNTPCYIPLDDEPTLDDLNINGYEWCLNKYRAIKKNSGNHRRALKDFEALKSFLD